jgi:hypothetical protein
MSIEDIRRIKAQALLPKPSRSYIIPKVSEKRKRQMKVWEQEDSDDKLQQWFEVVRLQLTGKCRHCGNPSCKESDEYYKFSIAHILPKAYFPSVATHPDNFVELCFWGNSCHTQMDNNILDMIDMACFDEIITKFQRIYPFIAKEEKRRIPAVLLNYIDIP